MNPEAVNELKTDAWVHAQAALAGIESKVRGKLKPTSTEVEVRTLYEDELIPFLINHLTRSEAACAVAVTKGIVPAPLIDALIGSLRTFMQAAVTGRRAYCKQKPCEWKGEVAEVGPTGKCPTCSHAPVTLLDLQVPPSANGRHIELP